ncbi:aspartate-alanine antiporter, partial [Undibacterium sp. CCC3.4]|nr:aspartate-alanine antiporter [Undibacterium sp. CCC3.4]
MAIADTTVVLAGDMVAVTGLIAVMEAAADYFGKEISAPADMLLVQESREIILTNRALSGREVGEIHDHVTVDTRHGVFLT